MTTIDKAPPEIRLDDVEAKNVTLERRVRELEDLLNYLGISSRAASPVPFRYDAATDTLVTSTGETTITETTILDSTHTAAADPHTGYLLESLADAKGDVLAATAADTWARVAVGANDTVLTAASGETPGVKWATLASLGASGGMLKVSGAGYEVTPSAAAGIDLANAGVAWNNGAYSEMEDSTPAAVYLIGFTYNASANQEFEVDIATGAAASETVVSTIALSPGAAVGETAVFSAVIAVATTTRIAARMRSGSTTATIDNLKLIFVRQSNLVAL